MKQRHNRAFKEWAVACDALRDGRQVALIRKGGIREEGGVFAVNDAEFFLMPTYEHQCERLLRADSVDRLRTVREREINPGVVTLDSYAVVDTITRADSDVQAFRIAERTVWNEEYVRLRLEYNPYDPLYLMVLRVYRLREPIGLPTKADYAGCRSWVTLDRDISTLGAVPALSDVAFEAAREELLRDL